MNFLLAIVNRRSFQAKRELDDSVGIGKFFPPKVLILMVYATPTLTLLMLSPQGSRIVGQRNFLLFYIE